MSDVEPLRTPAQDIAAGFELMRRTGLARPATEAYDATAPFKPWGIVWAGIRVDEFDRLGYDITEDRTLEAGWIRPHPVNPSSFAVWSLSDWHKLCEFSKWINTGRRRLPPAVRDALAGYPSIDIVALGGGMRLALETGIDGG